MNITLILLLPLLSSIIILVYGRNLGIYGAAILSSTNMFFVLCFTFFKFYQILIYNNYFYVDYSTWINVGLLNISWSFLFDMLTVSMLLTVSIVSLIVHIYSYEYMNNDPYIVRFFAYLSLFTFFMFVLVTANNLVQLFLGWEGVGICSYLLIGFWNTRVMANKSAIKALIVNKVGDVCLLLSMAIIFCFFKTLEFPVLFSLYPYFLNTTFIFLTYECNVLNLIGILILIACMAKSAQIGLHTWLPDAMEGPTPVSALIHAATMVTAGVFLIIRFSPAFEFMPNVLIKLIFVGSLTTFLGATIGMLQNDIKKIVAYSTCSQLGYMILACGVSNYLGSLFHLINHAFFKALLFLAAGAIIHALSDEQDIRKMGNLVQILPFIYISFLIGSLALTGFPFFSGYYSKDYILESTLIHYNINSNIAFWFGSVSAFFTAFYSFRLIFLVFFFNNNSYKQVIKAIREPEMFIFISLLVLIIFSIVAGFFLKDCLIGLGSDAFGSSIFISPWNTNLADVEFIPFSVKIIPIVVSLLGTYLILFIYNYLFYEVVKFKIKHNKIYRFFNQKWYFNNFYNYFLGKNIFNLSYDFFFIILEQGIFEPTGIVNLLYKMSIMSTNFLNDSINRYVLFILTHFFMFLILLLFII
jgi:NADH-ubiquinone oxidoreductase chain 5